MIVVAIIGILAAIAIPKFSQLITKGKRSEHQGKSRSYPVRPVHLLRGHGRLVSFRYLGLTDVERQVRHSHSHREIAFCGPVFNTGHGDSAQRCGRHRSRRCGAVGRMTTSRPTPTGVESWSIVRIVTVKAALGRHTESPVQFD